MSRLVVVRGVPCAGKWMWMWLMLMEVMSGWLFRVIVGIRRLGCLLRLLMGRRGVRVHGGVRWHVRLLARSVEA